MAESEEESAPKILVQAPNGDYWLISRDAIPVGPLPQEPALVKILNNTNTNLANYFTSANPGVKVGITIVDF
jgi:hypothetical protein